MTDRVVKFDEHPDRADRANFEGLTALVCVKSAESQAALSAAFKEVDGVECAFDASESTPTAALASAVTAPHVLFYEFSNDEQAVSKIHALRATEAGAQLYLVALMESPKKAGAVKLLLEGADDVVSTNPEGIDLARCLARVNARAREAVAGAQDSKPRTLVFMHAAGGAGATTLAVNSAVQLKRRMAGDNGGVCLLDLDIQFGDANLHVDVPVHSRLMDIINAPERLDHRMLEDLMIDGPLGLRMLTAPSAPMPLDIFQPQTIDTILSLARRHYRYVVVDMPLALTRWTETVLRRADHIFLVTQVNVTALRAARRLLDAVREGNTTPAPITVIANRYSGSRDAVKIPLSQAAKALGMPVKVVVPSDYGLLVESLDQGVPASMTRPGARFCESISKGLDGVVEHKAAKPVKAGGVAGVMKSLFKFRS